VSTLTLCILHLDINNTFVLFCFTCSILCQYKTNTHCSSLIFAGIIVSIQEEDTVFFLFFFETFSISRIRVVSIAHGHIVL